MKTKIFFLTIATFFFNFFITFAQGQRVDQARVSNHYFSNDYTTPDLLVKEFQKKLNEKTPDVVDGGWTLWLQFGAAVHGVDTAEFERMCLSEICILEEIPGTKLHNSGWDPEQKKYREASVPAEKIWVLMYADIPLIKMVSGVKNNGKVQPCINIVWKKEAKQQPKKEVVVEKPKVEKPDPDKVVIPGPPSNNATVMIDPNSVNVPVVQPTPQQQMVLLNFPQGSNWQSHLVGVNPVQPMSVYISNTNVVGGRPWNPQTQPSCGQQTTWGGSPFTGNVQPFVNGQDTTWGGNPYTGNTGGTTISGGGPFTGNTNTGGNFSGNGTVDGVNEILP
jgi:hypothetical protein